MTISCSVFSGAFRHIKKVLRRLRWRKRKSLSDKKKLMLEMGAGSKYEGGELQGGSEETLGTSEGYEDDALQWRLSSSSLVMEENGNPVLESMPHASQAPPPPPVVPARTEMYYYPQLEADWIDLGGPVDVDLAKRCNRIKCPGMPFDPDPPPKRLPRLGPHHGTTSHILRTTLVTQACITHNASLKSNWRAQGVTVSNVFAPPQRMAVVV